MTNEKIKEQKRKWWDKNKEKILKSNRDKLEILKQVENEEKLKEYRQKRALYHREWYQKSKPNSTIYMRYYKRKYRYLNKERIYYVEGLRLLKKLYNEMDMIKEEIKILKLKPYNEVEKDLNEKLDRIIELKEKIKRRENLNMKYREYYE